MQAQNSGENVFTARRHASAVYAVVVCLRVCVCVSITRQYYMKTAKLRIKYANNATRLRRDFSYCVAKDLGEI